MVDYGTVRKVAAIARISLSEDESARLSSELDEVLDIFSSLDEAETGESFHILPTDPKIELDAGDALPDPDKEGKEDGIVNEDVDLSSNDMISLSPNKKDRWIKGPRLR